MSAQDNYAEDDRRLLRARQPAPRRDRGGHGQHGGAGCGQHRPGRGPDPVRDALGQQRVPRQRLLLPAARQAERQYVVQQPRPAADPATGKAPKNWTSCISPARASAARSSSRACGTAATRRSSSSTTRSRARPGRTPRTARSCTRSPSRASSAGHRGGQTRQVNLLAARRDQRPARDARSDDRRGCSATSAARLTGAGTGLIDLTDPLLQQFTYQYASNSVTKYPTGGSTST